MIPWDQAIGIPSQRPQNMKDGIQTDVLIMDFSKAFDKNQPWPSPEKTQVFWHPRQDKHLDQRLPVQQTKMCRSWWRKIIRSRSEIQSVQRFHARTQPVSVLHQWHRGQYGINSPSLWRWHHCLLDSVLHPRCRNTTERSEKLGI